MIKNMIAVAIATAATAKKLFVRNLWTDPEHNMYGENIPVTAFVSSVSTKRRTILSPVVA